MKMMTYMYSTHCQELSNVLEKNQDVVSCIKMGPFEELDVYINNVINVSVEPCKGFMGVWRNRWLTCLRNLKRIARISTFKKGGNPAGRKWVTDAWNSMRYSGNKNNHVILGKVTGDETMQDWIMTSYTIPRR